MKQEVQPSCTDLRVTPVLRWAGGKTWLVKSSASIFPQVIAGDYCEPFLGGGAVFLSRSWGNAHLSDINPDLINFYSVLRAQYSELISHLMTLDPSEKEYYKIRSEQYADPVMSAAQFYYLNRLSFNGIYRVNRQGQFNVPYGKRLRNPFIDERALKTCSSLLSAARLTVADFETVLNSRKQGDFVFVDPPYWKEGESSFVGYNSSPFGSQELQNLLNCLESLDRRGVRWLMTYAHYEPVQEWADNFSYQWEVVYRSQVVGARAARRGLYGELLIKNY